MGRVTYTRHLERVRPCRSGLELCCWLTGSSGPRTFLIPIFSEPLARCQEAVVRLGNPKNRGLEDELIESQVRVHSDPVEP